nr:MAG TPA: Membrane-anchored junction protein [Caudoviricetes sp.]
MLNKFHLGIQLLIPYPFVIWIYVLFHALNTPEVCLYYLPY